MPIPEENAILYFLQYARFENILLVAICSLVVAVIIDKKVIKHFIKKNKRDSFLRILFSFLFLVLMIICLICLLVATFKFFNVDWLILVPNFMR